MRSRHFLLSLETPLLGTTSSELPESLAERLKSNKSQTQRSLVPCVTFVQDSTRLGLRGENWAKKPLRYDLESLKKAQRTTAEKTPKR